MNTTPLNFPDVLKKHGYSKSQAERILIQAPTGLRQPILDRFTARVVAGQRGEMKPIPTRFMSNYLGWLIRLLAP